MPLEPHGENKRSRFLRMLSSLIRISRNVNNLQLLMVFHLPRRVLRRATMMKLYPSMRGSLNHLTALMLTCLLTMMVGRIIY